MPDLEGAEAREREQRRDIHSGYGLHDVSLHALEGVPRRLSCRERGSVEHSVARFHLFVADVSVRDDTEHAAKGPADDDPGQLGGRGAAVAHPGLDFVERASLRFGVPHM